MASMKYWVWLASQEKLRPAEKSAVLAHFGDPETAFFAPRGAYAAVEGLRESAAEELEAHDLSRADHILGECERQNIRPVCLQDTAYPQRLKHIFAPPAVLYVKGRLRDLDDEAAIAVVGTRQATPYGLRMARELAWGIIRCGGVLLSGLGSGIDGEAAKAALEADGYCVGVLGTPHEQAGGWLHRQVGDWGALLSEYAPGTAPQRHYFRERNRITAGLSVGVVVVEAPEKSGARLFANEANEQGKEIFAVPGPVGAPNSVGTIALIQEGAAPVTCGWDVMREFAGRFPDRIRRNDSSGPLETPVQRAEAQLQRSEEPQASAGSSGEKVVDSAGRQDYIDWKEQLSQLSEEQLRIVTAIGKDAVHIDDIAESTGLSTAKVLSQLTVLEIRGYIRREAGRRFALKITKK